MSNALIRAGSSYLIPGTPERVARPAYTWFETRTGYATSAGGSGWIQVPITQLINGQNVVVGYEVIHVGPGTGFQTNSYTYTIRHDEPAVAAAPATPAIRVEDPPMGWTSFGHTIAFIERTGEATFKVPANVSGAAVGLTREPRPVAGYSHIPHGLIFTGGKAYLKSSGALLGTYLGSDVFKIKNSAGTVSYLKGATSLTSEPEAIPSGSQLYLGAALYRATDRVSDPLLTEVREGSAAMSEAPMSLLAADYAYASAQLVEAPMTMVAGPGGIGAALIEAPMVMLASDYAYAGAALVEPPMTMTAFSESVVIDTGNYADLIEAEMVMGALGYTGSTGSAAMSEAPMAMLAADYAYASAQLVEAPMVMSAYVEPANVGYILQMLSLDIQMDAVLGVEAALPIHFALDVQMTALLADTALMPVHLLLDIPMLAVVDAHASMLIEMVLDIPMTVPGADLNVWAVNLATSGSTSYSNYPFNSFARIGSRYYGAKDDGIFDLDADTDAGAPIRAAVSLGSKDFGSPQQKSIVEAFAAMSSTGRLFLRILAEGCDYLYAVDDHSERMQQQRFRFGKGLKANYITPILYNEKGGDFAIDALQFEIADLSRKLKGS